MESEPRMNQNNLARGVFEAIQHLKNKKPLAAERKLSDLFELLEAQGAKVNKEFYSNGTYKKKTKKKNYIKCSKSKTKLVFGEARKPSTRVLKREETRKIKKLYDFSGACDYYSWREWKGLLKRKKLDGTNSLEVIKLIKELEAKQLN